MDRLSPSLSHLKGGNGNVNKFWSININILSSGWFLCIHPTPLLVLYLLVIFLHFHSSIKHLLSSHLNQSQATQMRHLPGKQFHSSHWIAENNDLFLFTIQLLWGGCLGVFTSSPGSSETFSMGPNRIKKTRSIRCTKGSVSVRELRQICQWAPAVSAYWFSDKV